MKPINFIKTLTISEQRALQTWWLFSLMISVAGMIVICFLHGMQCYEWYRLHHERREIAPILAAGSASMQRYNEARKQEQLLAQQMNKCAAISQTFGQIRDRIIALRKTCDTATIVSCCWNKQDVELSIALSNILDVGQLSARLQTISGLEKLSLISMVPSSAGVVVTLRAKK